MSAIKQKEGQCCDCPPNTPDQPIIAGRCIARHYWAYRKSLKQQKPKKLSKPIRQVSKKRSVENREYGKRRKEFLTDHKRCEANLTGCTKHATDVHHKAGRGDNFLKVETWIAVCRCCHIWIEEHPEKAKELNLSQSRLTNETSK
ncbi:hypothetical protein D3C80_677070 [compost metagenome]